MGGLQYAAWMKIVAGATKRIIIVRRWRRWWKPWDVRGTVEVANLTGLHELTPRLAMRLSDYELHLFPHVRTNDVVAHSIVQAEMRRREARTARLALTISVISAAISLATLINRLH